MQHITGEGYLLYKNKNICLNCSHKLIPLIYETSFNAGGGGFAVVLFKKCLEINLFRKRRNQIKQYKKIFNKLLNKYKFKCVNCGAMEGLEIDHIIPVSKGGIDDINNLQILCKSCNVRKSNKI